MLKKTSNFSRSQTGDKTKKIFLYLIIFSYAVYASNAFDIGDPILCV